MASRSVAEVDLSQLGDSLELVFQLVCQWQVALMEQSLIRGYPLFCCRNGLLRTTREFTVIRKVPGDVRETESSNLASMFIKLVVRQLEIAG